MFSSLLARVDDCIYRIGDLATQWSLNDPVDIDLRISRDDRRFVVEAIRPVPPLIWLLFSEGISHLRAALDNAVWHLLERAHGPIDPKVASRVTMPIYSEPERYLKWRTERKKDGLPELDADAALGERIGYLQPCHTTETVPSVDEFLGAVLHEDVEHAHPLTLLQAYSNADKHRAIRVAITRVSSSVMGQPMLAQDLRFRELAVGDSLSTGPRGKTTISQITPAIMIRRPQPFIAAVAPGRELSHLHEYIRGVAIPTLISGVALPRALPPHIKLGDTGTSQHDRIAHGSWPAAQERLQPLIDRRYREAFEGPPSIPRVAHEDDEGGGGVTHG